MSKIKILIADDEEIIQLLFAKMFALLNPPLPLQGGDDLGLRFEKDGYELVTVYDGNEAEKKIQQESFDLVILDLQMPGRNGIEILKAVKEKKPDTEVLISTEYASLETAIEAIRNGACDYVEKPFDMQEIRKIIARALEKRRLVLEKHLLMEQLKKRVFELDVLYNVSNAISYTLDFKQLVSLIMASINKVVEYDVSCSLLSTGQSINLMVQKVKPVTADFIQAVKANVISAFNALVKNPISESEIEISLGKAFHKHRTLGRMGEERAAELGFRISDFGIKELFPLNKGGQGVVNSAFRIPHSQFRCLCNGRQARGEEGEEALKVQSFFNVPLMIQDEVVGMINVSSRRKNAFGENDVRLMYTIANQMSNAIKRLKAVIATEKSKMKTMVDGMIEGVIMMDEKGHMMVLNSSAKRILSFNVDHEVTVSQLKERLKELNIDWILYDRENETISKEITLDEKIVHISAEKIHDDNNQTIGLVIVLRDITQQKKIEQAKLDFVSDVSHEIRTPLSMIKNAVSLIEMAGEVNENQQKFLSIATRNIDRLARLVNDVLDISKMESGKLEMQFEMLSINSLIDDSIEAQKTQANEKGIQISGKVDDTLSQVYGDRDRLEQVLTNLINNAMKFTNEGGCITVEAKGQTTPWPPLLRGKGKRDRGQLPLSPLACLPLHRQAPLPPCLPHFEPKFAEISVSDTGVGISTDDQKKIFDKFQQVNTSSYYKTTGFGLGLAITKELILSHQGEIWVDSELGRGSRFTFTIPVDRESYEIARFLKSK